MSMVWPESRCQAGREPENLGSPTRARGLTVTCITALPCAFPVISDRAFQFEYTL
jgi:hypothetical protein